MNLALVLTERPPAIDYNFVKWREVACNKPRAMHLNEVWYNDQLSPPHAYYHHPIVANMPAIDILNFLGLYLLPRKS